MALEIARGIYWVGANDTEISLFESLWPVPEGVSYNSYLVVGEEGVALIDPVRSRFASEMLEKVGSVVDPRDLDYVVLNHAEPDHSSGLPPLLSSSPKAVVVGTTFASRLLDALYRLEREFRVVKSGDRLDLGGKSLEFTATPWLHWPETMMTYVPEEKVLFSGDAFGAYGALGADALFDNQLDEEELARESKEYFATIVSGFSKSVLGAVEKLKDLEVRILAPSHGPVYRSRPSWIVELWSKWSKPVLEEKVVVVYASMYGNTEKLARAVARGVEKAGLEAPIHDLSESEINEVLADVIDAPGIAIGSPTYELNPFPAVAYFVELVGLKKIAGRVVGLFGSFGWSGGAVAKLKKRLTELKMQVLERAVEVRGSPTDEDLGRAEELGRELAKKAEEIATSSS